MEKKKTSLTPYILLNIVISAMTTLLVLLIWNGFQKAKLPEIQPQEEIQPGILQPTLPLQPSITDIPIPSINEPVVEIDNVFGIGDINFEEVILKRLGEGDINMTGWEIQDQNNNQYLFPNLIMKKDSHISIYTKTGSNSVNDLYWGLDFPVWKIGEKVTVLDSEGLVRAEFWIE
ncbi:MAG: lamin tail domain-containing protein [Anaerolineaceae bacterium]|nr:lamin tail domain-containing protein [Anaerolineaceae bacterium]